jgi:hypothetical protein
MNERILDWLLKKKTHPSICSIDYFVRCTAEEGSEIARIAIMEHGLSRIYYSGKMLMVPGTRKIL